jgi:spore coat protein CotH
MSSFGMVAAGSKRSLNLSVDLADEKQRLLGYKTLNLLNAHEDPSFISTVLYSQIARKHIAAPKANLVKVVINGESWGIYANVQQFNKEFMIDNFKSPKGARWKVSGSPGGRGGLEYTGDNVEDYKRRFEIKSADKKESWQALINLCRVLNQTPPENLKTELEKILDIDGLLWFLALDIGLINRDGYWIRSSDYSIALDEKGKFHILPHDMNEAFHAPHGPGMGGPGGRGGPGGGPGGFPAPPKPTDIFPFFLRDMLELDDAQRKKLDALQKDTDTKLEALFTPEQRKQLEEMKNAPPMVFGIWFGDQPLGRPDRSFQALAQQNFCCARTETSLLGQNTPTGPRGFGLGKNGTYRQSLARFGRCRNQSRHSQANLLPSLFELHRRLPARRRRP